MKRFLNKRFSISVDIVFSYDTLSAIEEALKDNDPFAMDLQKKAQSIIYKQRIG